MVCHDNVIVRVSYTPEPREGFDVSCSSLCLCRRETEYGLDKDGRGGHVGVDACPIAGVCSAVRGFGSMRFLPLFATMWLTMFGFVYHCAFFPM